MGEKNNEPKYMEGNYSKDPLNAEMEYIDDLIQAEQLQQQEYYWKSYLNAVEKLRKEHHYLVDGAVLRCSRSTTNPIKITQSKGRIVKYEECTEDMMVGEAVVLEDPENMECFRVPKDKSEVRLKVLQNTAAINGSGQYFATVKDTKKGGIGYYFDHDTDDYNIRFFGNCKNAPDRDDECKAIIMAAESTKLRNIGTCPYLMKLNDEWENFPSDVNYEEVTTLDGELSELITMEAILFCKHGGFITPVTSGQNVLTSEDALTDDKKDLRKRRISKKALRALMELEILNNSSLEKNYLVIEDGKLIGIKPHLAGDGYVTFGFGDCIQEEEELEFYKDSERCKYISGPLSYNVNEYDSMKDTVIPVEICFEKLIQDITPLYEDAKSDFEQEGLTLSQNQLDALSIIKYQCYTIGSEAYNAILNNDGREKLYEAVLKKHGKNEGLESRTKVEMNIYYEGNFDVEGGLSDIIVEPLEEYEEYEK